MFSNWFLKSFRILLLPFAFLYGLVIIIRNWLYDKNISRSTTFALPLICVGNLSVGGTGKSPMVELLVRKLKDRFKVATLSRGYKRKTKGYVLASEQTTSIEIGDEPMQFHRKFPGIPVAVGEERIVAIPQLLHDRPESEVIILDDAFQHRAIKAGLNILLTDYNNLFTRDFYLPTGDLRDSRSSYKRADIIVVTKCPSNFSEEERMSIAGEIEPLPHQQIFFANITYGNPYHIINGTEISFSEQTEVLLVTGIANPKPLKKYLEECSRTYFQLQYSDHHIFTIDDFNEITDRFEHIHSENKIILTTEKDATRLLKFSQRMDGMPFYVIPVEHSILFGQEEAFTRSIMDFIEHFAKPI
ncbi:tetraacyldisaccharide 4'-kinase [Chitinophagaceae bacterium LB-8]|uniref:Tetraacyldisaccharide 4'-kinase n=1 Tax=Paraflavisolibacter caeni TaxID=2982496 RepID=A0A9X2XXZ5_9BACT|nr:tetraacyldisaccharide 4'-kinase [Paraflavisolibacter caeni]MCU7551471.1 tetraacyldisaccharide 4'-kinase [Paraflavisolibacter caeni]